MKPPSHAAICEWPPLRAAASAGFAYEALALATGRLPTISTCCRRRWPRIVGVVAVLVAHLATLPDKQRMLP